MLNIFPNVGRSPLDGTDAQSRWPANGDGSRSEAGTSGFDDVFSQVNRASSTSAAGSDEAGRSASSGRQSDQKSGSASGGLDDLLARARRSSGGASVPTPADATRARAAAASAADETADATAMTGADDPEGPPTLAAATADFVASLPPTGEPVPSAAISPTAAMALADLSGIAVHNARSQGATPDPTIAVTTTPRRPNTDDPAEAAPAVNTADAVLTALLVAQGAAPAPAPILQGKGTIAALPPAYDRKETEAAGGATGSEAASDLAETHVDVAEPSEASSETLPSTTLDAQVVLRPAGGDRTLVSVVAQATHFPVVERLSLTQQLAAPIAEAAQGIADTPATSTANAPIRTLDVTLSPGNLGSVTISMRLVGGSLHLGVEAQEAGTARLIEREKSTLADALHASGYSVADLNIVHGAEAGGRTQSGGYNASQDQRTPSRDTSGSETSGDGSGARRDGGTFSGDQAAPRHERPNGERDGSAFARPERGVYV